MPRKKKEPSPPPAPDRSIKCAFCQKELNPPTDAVTFIGVGKWRDGPGSFLAVFSAKAHDGQENPCFRNGMSWATKFTNEKPVLLTFPEWKARTTRRSVNAIRAANGRYELNLTESHLNCFYFLETKHASTAAKAKEIVGRWQADWSLLPEDVPDIDQIERDALHAEEVQRIRNMRLNEAPPTIAKVELPEELKKELDRHSDKYMKHFLANISAGGDDCKSCCISRGMRKLCVIGMYLPLIQQSLDMMSMVRESASLSCFMGSCRKVFDDAVKSLCDELKIKPDDETHNEAARKRNKKDIRLAKALIEKYRIKT